MFVSCRRMCKLYMHGFPLCMHWDSTVDCEELSDLLTMSQPCKSVLYIGAASGGIWLLHKPVNKTKWVLKIRDQKDLDRHSKTLNKNRREYTRELIIKDKRPKRALRYITTVILIHICKLKRGHPYAFNPLGRNTLIHFNRPPAHKISCCKFKNESIKQKMHLDDAKKFQSQWLRPLMQLLLSQFLFYCNH